MDAIEVSGIKKRFSDKDGGRFGHGGGSVVWALKGIDLRVRKGEIFGLLGPNGAGKTTLIYALSTLVSPTSGTARVMGYDVTKQANEVRGITGLCMGGTKFYDDLSPREILEYYGRLYGLPKDKRRGVIAELVERLGIREFENKMFSDLSTGMKQKVAVAKSLVNEPWVLFLDEPTAGLDVEIADEVRNFIMELVREREMTVILTSHILPEVEKMCDRIAIIDRGRKVIEGGIGDIRKSMRFPDVIKFYLDRYDNVDFVRGLRGVTGFKVDDSLSVSVDSGLLRLNQISSALAKRKYRVLDVEVKKADLEDVFFRAVGREEGA